MFIPGGATLWARQTIESDIFYNKPAEWFKIWFYIVQRVNHTESQQFKRGVGYFNWQDDKRNLKGVKVAQWNNCIKWLKKAEQIATQKTTRGNVISVLNYEKFQNIENYKKDTKSQAESQARTEQKPSKSQTICNNGNNGNNGNNILPNKVRSKSLTTKPMYEEPVIELDEEGEEIPPIPKKYKDKRKLYTRLIVHYKELTGEPAPVTRYLSAMKELVVIAESVCDSEEEIEKEIKVRLKVASAFYASKEWGYPTLEKLAKSWNKIPDWKRELK